MKYKFLLLAMSLLLIVGLYVPSSYSATPTYTMTLANNAQTEANVYEFDIYILWTGGDTLKMSGAQMVFNYDGAVLNGGTLKTAWVPGSNDPVIVAANKVNTSFNIQTLGSIKIAAKYTPGKYAIISNVAPGTRIGRLRLTNSIPFIAQKANVTWNFTGYATKISANISGKNIDITVPANHLLSGSFQNPALPVELSSFVSIVQGRNIVLNWSTKTEKNSDRFEIQRAVVDSKTSNTTWTTASSVKAAVLSNLPKQYSYSDTKLQSGKYQYRLKMVDNNSTFSYSNVVETEVAVPKDFAVSQNYPNPFNPSTKIDYQVPVDAKVLLEVYNVAGQRVFELVNQDQSAGYYTIDFGLSSVKLSSGVYIYRIIASDKATGNNFSSIKKMILLK
jgi:Secretion system C-terminal sorting domain